MDVTDAAVRGELERRLAEIAATETGDEAHAPLSSADLIICVAIVVVSVLVGLLVTL